MQSFSSTYAISVFLLSCSSLTSADRVILAPSPSGAELQLFDRTVKTLPCRIDFAKPRLDMDLRFHSGYLVQIPVADATAAAGELRSLIRITPEQRPEQVLVIETS